MNPYALVVGIALIVVLAVAAAPASGSAHFDVGVSPSIDVPDRTVAFEEGEHAIEELGRIERGETIEARVDVDESTRARLQLVDDDHNRLAGDEGRGDAHLDFSTDDLEPGTYLVVLRVNGSVVDLEPVVVSAYDVSVSAPDAATAGSSVEVSAEVTPVGSQDAPDRVQVVLGDESERVRTTLSRESESTYTGSVDTGSLSGGTYTLYAVAQGVEVFAPDERVVLGASDARTLELAAPATTESDAGSGGGSGGGGSGGSGDGSGGGSAGSAGGGGGSSGGGGGSSDGSVGADTGGSDGATTQAGATAVDGSDASTDVAVGTASGRSPIGGRAGLDGPATAGTRAATESDVRMVAASGGQPGFGVGVAVVALLAAALLAIRRRG